MEEERWGGTADSRSHTIYSYQASTCPAPLDTLGPFQRIRVGCSGVTPPMHHQGACVSTAGHRPVVSSKNEIQVEV